MDQVSKAIVKHLIINRLAPFVTPDECSQRLLHLLAPLRAFDLTGLLCGLLPATHSASLDRFTPTVHTLHRIPYNISARNLDPRRDTALHGLKIAARAKHWK